MQVLKCWKIQWGAKGGSLDLLITDCVAALVFEKSTRAILITFLWIRKSVLHEQN